MSTGPSAPGHWFSSATVPCRWLPRPDAGLCLQQAAHTQEALEEAVQMMKEAVEDLTTTLNEAASAAGVVGGMVDSITQAINQARGSIECRARGREEGKDWPGQGRVRFPDGCHLVP